jgi:hypothetical protein
MKWSVEGPSEAAVYASHPFLTVFLPPPGDHYRFMVLIPGPNIEKVLYPTQPYSHIILNHTQPYTVLTHHTLYSHTVLAHTIHRCSTS